MTRSGIVSWASYLPFHRLDRTSVAATLGCGGGRGTRTVASYDEDTTSMGVEAARRALRALPELAERPTAIYFSTSAPAYLEKSNASAIHAALGLDSSVTSYDFAGGVRSGVGALQAALDRREPTLVVLSDIRGGMPGGADESAGGDAAVAFVTGTGDLVAAKVIAAGGTSKELLDRWRLPTSPTVRSWEERFGESHLVGPAEQALAETLKKAGLTVDEVDRTAVSGPSARTARAVVTRIGVAKETLADDLSGTVGFTGAAHAGLLLASILDDAGPGQVLASLSFADGADALLLRTTDAVARPRTAVTVAAQAAGGGPAVPYPMFLSWRGHLHRDPPRRPDPHGPLAPASERADGWKFGFTASRCQDCGRRHLPPQRVCLQCRSMDRMDIERAADDAATIVTYTIDRLAYSPSPPMVVVAVDFDGGGRFQCELTDVDPDTVRIGQRVEMTFRRLFTADDVHNYFWKARPIPVELGEGAQ